VPQINAERPQIGSEQLSALPANVAPTLATPATALVLEREAAPAEAAATIQSGPVGAGTLQNAARAEPSAFAALTGAAGQDPASARKARRDSETGVENGLAASKTPAQASSAQIAADLAASALPQTQPVTGPANAEAAAPAAAQTAEGIGFDALVDSIARARDGATSESTSIAMRHTEFGRVSLRFQAEADGLSVAMTSADPTFAPAVAAARAAEAAAAAAITSDTAQRSVQASSASSQGGETTASSQNGGQNGSQGSAGHQRMSANPAANAAPRGAETPADDGRSGIFA
jgi:hypothetical protein